MFSVVKCCSLDDRKIIQHIKAVIVLQQSPKVFLWNNCGKEGWSDKKLKLAIVVESS